MIFVLDLFTLSSIYMGDQHCTDIRWIVWVLNQQN